MSWEFILKQSLPVNEIALFSILSEDSATETALISVIESKATKSGSRKRDFANFIKKYDGSSRKSLLNSLEPSNRPIFRPNIAKIYKNFNKTGAAIRKVFQREAKPSVILEALEKGDEESTINLFNRLNVRSIKSQIRKLPEENIKKIEKLLNKYAVKPEKVSQFDSVLNYGYAVFEILVLRPPISKVSGFESENGPVPNSTIFKRIIKIKNTDDSEEQINKQAELLNAAFKKEDKKFILVYGEEDSKSNSKIDLRFSEASKSFNKTFNKISNMRFQSPKLNRTYSVATIGAYETKAYFDLLYTPVFERRKGVATTRSFTNELLLDLGSRSLFSGTPTPIVKKSTKTFRPVDFAYLILTSSANDGKTIFLSAERQTVGGLRYGTATQSTGKDKEEGGIGAKSKLDSENRPHVRPNLTVRQKVNLISDKVLEILELDDMYEGDGKIKITPEIQNAIDEIKQEGMDGDRPITSTGIKKLKEIEPKFDEKVYNMEIFIKPAESQELAEEGSSLDALIELAKQKGTSVDDLLNDRSNLGVDKMGESDALRLLNFINMLEYYTSTDFDETLQQIYTPQEKGNEEGAGIDKPAKGKFLDLLYSTIEQFVAIIRKAIKKKFQSILDNPRRYPILYDIQEGITILDPEIALPEILFNMDIEGRKVKLIRRE